MSPEKKKLKDSPQVINILKREEKTFADEILLFENGARYYGILPESTAKFEETWITNAVLLGGYEDLPFLDMGLFGSLKNSQSFDTYIQYGHLNDKPEVLKIELNYYGSNGIKYVLSGNYKNNFRLKIEYSPNIASANYNADEEIILSEAEFKLMLIGVSKNQVENSIINNPSGLTLDKVADIVNHEADQSANVRVTTTTYGNELSEMNEESLRPPRSELKVTRKTEYGPKNEESYHTRYEISYRIINIFDYEDPEDGKIPIWTFVDYLFYFEINEKDKLVSSNSAVQVVLQDPTDAQKLPLGWIDFRREEVARTAKKDLPLMIQYSINSLFTDQKIENEKSIYDPTPDN